MLIGSIFRAWDRSVTIPYTSVLRIQVWDGDWDLASANDKIAETRIDIENGWFSCHRATFGLAKRYDSADCHACCDTKKPTIILDELCPRTNFRSLSIDNVCFDCDPECVEFLSNEISNDMSHRKVHYGSPEEQIRKNTGLVSHHGWGR